MLSEIAERQGVTPAQVVIRWHIDHEVVVIPKSASPERITSNFDVFGFALDDAELHQIDGLSGDLCVTHSDAVAFRGLPLRLLLVARSCQGEWLKSS
ncbi:MAG TPA: aldo/keto reductase [Acidimicrobiales bacterium]|nr:aldo/keto reductase [Acidimicrobiales bacterium]